MSLSQQLRKSTNLQARFYSILKTTSYSLEYSCILFYYFRTVEKHLKVLLRAPEKHIILHSACSGDSGSFWKDGCCSSELLSDWVITSEPLHILLMYIQSDLDTYWMPYYAIVNLVTVTRMNMTDKMPSGYGTLRTTAVRIWHQVSYWAVRRSQLLSRPSAIPRRGLCCSGNHYSYKWSIKASWIHLHHCRTFQEHMRILLQRLRALCLAPGEPGSNWKYLEALVRSTRVSGMLECSFWTYLHFADVVTYVQKIILQGYFQMFTVHLGTSSIIGPPGLWTSTLCWPGETLNIQWDEHWQLVVGHTESTTSRGNDCTCDLGFQHDAHTFSLGHQPVWPLDLTIRSIHNNIWQIPWEHA